MKSLKVKDKVALVTASSTGIGFAIAKKLASEGAKVIVSSRNQKNVDEAVASINSNGFLHKVTGFVFHVGNQKDREGVVAKIVSEFGKIDILICNAAVSTHMGDVLSITEAQYDKMFDTNVKATFFLCRALEPHFQDGGSIVIISSFVAYNSDPLIGIYSVTKTALLGLTKVLAKALEPRGIRVNAVAPGLIRTKFASVIIENIEEMTKRSGIDKVGEPDQIANLVSFLASKESSFINGECVQAVGNVTPRL